MVKFHFLALSSLAIVAAPNIAHSAGERCVPERETVQFKSDSIFTVDPNGNRVYHYDYGNVLVSEISNRAAVGSPVKTGLKRANVLMAPRGNVASFVLGTTKEDTYGFQLFSASDVLEPGRPAPATEIDSDLPSPPESVAEMPPLVPNFRRLRTTMDDGSVRDYELRMSPDGKVLGVSKSQIGRLCGNLFPAKIPTAAQKSKHQALLKIAKAKADEFARDYDRQKKPDFDWEYREGVTKFQDDADEALHGAPFTTHRAERDAAYLESRRLEAELAKVPAYREAFAKEASIESVWKAESEKIRSHPEILALNQKHRDLFRSKTYSADKADEIIFAILKTEEKLRKESPSYQRAGDEYFAAQKNRRNLTDQIPVGQKLIAAQKRRWDAERKMSQIKGGAAIEGAKLSSDGSHVVGYVGDETKAYKMADDGTCKEVAAIKGDVGGFAFNFPKPGQPTQLVFNTSIRNGENSRTDVMTIDLSTGKTSKISGNEKEGASQGQFLADGRISYLARGGPLTFVDPVKLAGKGCLPASTGVQNQGGSQGGAVTR